MAKYLCTCNKGKNRGWGNKLYPTEVNSKGICIYCGHYAYAQPSDKHLRYPRNPVRPYENEPTKTKSYWSKSVGIDKYYQYFHGVDQPKWGQKKIERKLYKQLSKEDFDEQNSSKLDRTSEHGS